MKFKHLIYSLAFASSLSAMSNLSAQVCEGESEAERIKREATTEYAKDNDDAMTAEQLLEMARVGLADLAPKGDKLIYTVSLPNIAKNASETAIYEINIDGSGRKQISPEGQNCYAPKYIDGGKRIAFMSVVEGTMQVCSMALDGSDIRQLTKLDGGLHDYKFSPDGKQILYVQDIPLENKAVDIYPDLPEATGRVINDLMYKHWDEWVDAIPHIFYAQLGEEPIEEGLDILEDEPFEAPMKPYISMGDVNWSPDGRYIVYASRKKTGVAYSISTNSDIYLFDTKTKETRNLTEGMMGYDTDPVFAPNGKTLAWVSMERDGYESDLRRLFVMDMRTGKKTWLAQDFECNVEAPAWSQDGKKIYFISCIQAEKQLFAIDVKSQKLRQITKGQHNYTSFLLGPKFIIAGRQSMKVPTDLYQVDIRSGKALAITQENKEVLDELADITVEKRWIDTTNGEKMLVWVIYPPHFDKKKVYPALLYCQGGPQSAVSQFFSFRWNFRIMAEQGYIVIAPNRHGVPSFGKAWNEQISGDYPGQNIQDYLSAVDALKKEPYINPEGIGCVGASYGGFSAYYLAGHHDKRFSAFIAHAGIFNMEMQYLTTEEMWFANWDMGGAYWEKDNKVAQRTFEHSPHKFVDKWDTPMLVIHGEKDFRILADQGMAAFNAAKLRGIPSQLLVFPDEGHWVLKPQNALLWQRTFFAWLNKWLKPKFVVPYSE